MIAMFSQCATVWSIVLAGLNLLSSGRGQFTVLHTFDQSSGTLLNSNLVVQGSVLFGTTTEKAEDATGGTIFRMQIDGTGFKVIHRFEKIPGNFYVAGLVVDGATIYGVADTMGRDEGQYINGSIRSLGHNGFGYVFSMRLDGSRFAILHRFDTASEAVPDQLEISGHMLYGTTDWSHRASSQARIYRMLTDGHRFRWLYPVAFPSGYTLEGLFGDTLVVNKDAVYCSGTATFGTGDGGSRLIFETDASGKCRVIHKFKDELNSAGQFSGLVRQNETLFGTTGDRNQPNPTTIFSVRCDGSHFFTLHSFNRLSSDRFNESFCIDSLIAAPGTLYGTVRHNQPPYSVSIFRMRADGTGYRVLYTIHEGQHEAPVTVVRQGAVLYGTVVGYTHQAPYFGTRCRSRALRRHTG